MADKEQNSFDYHLESLGAVIYELSLDDDSVDDLWQHFEHDHPKEAVELLSFANRKEAEEPGAKFNVIAGFMLYYSALERSEKARKLMQELFPLGTEETDQAPSVAQLPLPIENNSETEAA